jgi:hypothetical protein
LFLTESQVYLIILAQDRMSEIYTGVGKKTYHMQTKVICILDIEFKETSRWPINDNFNIL